MKENALWSVVSSWSEDFRETESEAGQGAQLDQDHLRGS